MLLILFIVAMLIYGVRAYMDVHTPLRLLTGAFDRLAQGDMDFQVQYDKPNEFQYLTNRFNITLLKLKDTVSLLLPPADFDARKPKSNSFRPRSIRISF